MTTDYEGGTTVLRRRSTRQANDKYEETKVKVQKRRAHADDNEIKTARHILTSLLFPVLVSVQSDCSVIKSLHYSILEPSKWYVCGNLARSLKKPTSSVYNALYYFQNQTTSRAANLIICAPTSNTASTFFKNVCPRILVPPGPTAATPDMHRLPNSITISSGLM